MGRVRTGHALGANKTEGRQVEPREQVLPLAQKDRGNGKVKFVEESRLQILPDDGDAAADANVFVARSPSLASAPRRYRRSRNETRCRPPSRCGDADDASGRTPARDRADC